MITIKLPYKTSEENSQIIKEYQHQYSLCLRYMFKRRLENISETKIKHININHTKLLDSWFKQSCVKEASQLKSSSKERKVYFGGKSTFFKRLSNKISKEEYKEKRLMPLCSIGEKSNLSVKGNRKFKIDESLEFILFKPKKNISIKLDLPKITSNYKITLSKLFIRQQDANMSISYKLDQHYIYISYDENNLANENLRKIKNRILSIDLNPNYIGWSIVDWINGDSFKIIESGVYDISKLTDKKENQNKLSFETFQISKDLINKCTHYQVECIGIEDLNIKTSNKLKGRNFNRLVNNKWLRNKFVANLQKRANLNKIFIRKIKCEYSSFIGNLAYKNLNLPDMVCSAIEIGRRIYEFKAQYIDKIKEKEKNIIFPTSLKINMIIQQSLEEIMDNLNFKTVKKAYELIKNSKVKYRISLSQEMIDKVFSLKSSKSYVVNNIMIINALF